MNNETKIKMTKDKALELLPWYNINSLSQIETDQISSLLLSSSSIASANKAEDEMRSLVKNDPSLLNYSLLDSVESRLENVFDIIDQESRSEPLAHSQFSLNKWLKSFLSIDGSKVQYAAFTAISTISVALMFAFVTPLLTEKNVYYPATIETAANKKTEKVTTLLVGLSTERNDPKLLKVLNEMQANISPIPGKDGMYRIKYTKILEKSETKRLLNELSKHKDLFWFSGEDY